jgi:hypothetical protein
MKYIELKNGRGGILEPGEPWPECKSMSSDDEGSRVLAAVATVEKREPVMFAEELEKAKAALGASAVVVEEKSIEDREP